MLPAMPAEAGPPFVTDDPDTPDKGHFEINLAAQYTRFNGGSAANVPSLEVNYGVLSNLQATILVPLGLSQVSGVGTNVGFGDVELELKYRFIEEDSWGWRPAVATAPQINLPTGSEARGLGAGRFTGFIPIWAQKDIGSVDGVRRRRPQHKHRPRPEELVVLGCGPIARARSELDT